MRYLVSLIILILCLSVNQVQGAVSLSQNQTGQALVVPYYTVANNLNTLVSINNTQDRPKAIKVHIKDGRQGAAMNSFNLYLAANDIFTFAMVESDYNPKLVSNDLSCTLNIDVFPPGNPVPPNSGWDMLTGTIEIIEMGNVLTASNEFFGDISDEENCQRIDDAWNAHGPNSFWQAASSAELAAVSGGLTADVSVIDVANGFAFKVPILALENFFPADTIYHRHPESAEPDLASGTHDSQLIHKGQIIQTTWPTGYEAISALIMKSQISNEYNIEAILAAKTDWILSFPTWPYHQLNASSSVPFLEADGGFIVSNILNQKYFLYDSRGNEYHFNPPFPIDPPPPPSLRDVILYGVTNTYHLLSDYGDESDSISGNERDNVQPLYLSPALLSTSSIELFEIASGHIELRFDGTNSSDNDRGKQTDSGIQHVYSGLPVTGISVMRFYNAAAQPGLLAAYVLAKPGYGTRAINTTPEVSDEH